MSKLLINERPMMLLPSLAEKIGHDQAIVLQQIQYWLDRHEEIGNERTFRKGRWWVYNTSEEWQQKQFRWWSVPTLKRILQTLEKMGLVLTERFESADWNQRKWYSIDYDAIASLEETDFEGWKLSRDDLIKKVSEIASNARGLASDQIDPINELKLIQSSGSKRSVDLYTEITCPEKTFAENTERVTCPPQVDFKVKQPESQKQESVSNEPHDDRYLSNFWNFTYEDATKWWEESEEVPLAGEEESKKAIALSTPQVEPVNSSTGKARSSRKDKNKRRAFLSKNENFDYDDEGWLQLPEEKEYSVARLIAVRRMQAWIAFSYLGDVISLDRTDDGWLVYDGGRLRLCNTKDSGNWESENEFFASNGGMALKAARSYATQKDMLQYEYNEKFQEIFWHTIDWINENGQNKALELINEGSIVEEFDDAGEIEFGAEEHAYRSGGDGSRIKPTSFSRGIQSGSRETEKPQAVMLTHTA